MNKDLLIERMTESSALDESVGAQIAQIGRLDQQRVIKTVIKYGNERIELNLSEKLLKLGLDLHYRQVTVAMQEDGRLVVPRRGFSWKRGRFSGALFRGNWRVGYGVI